MTIAFFWQKKWSPGDFQIIWITKISRLSITNGRSTMVACWLHKQEVWGSNPSPAHFFCCLMFQNLTKYLVTGRSAVPFPILLICLLLYKPYVKSKVTKTISFQICKSNQFWSCISGFLMNYDVPTAQDVSNILTSIYSIIY